MIEELRKVNDRNKQLYVRGLQYKKRIRKIVNKNGYVCYDTEELKKYQKGAHKGRPPKID